MIIYKVIDEEDNDLGRMKPRNEIAAGILKQQFMADAELDEEGFEKAIKLPAMLRGWDVFSPAKEFQLGSLGYSDHPPYKVDQWVPVFIIQKPLPEGEKEDVYPEWES